MPMKGAQSTDHVMASLDVEALFTNIPLEETINICVELAFKESDEVKGLNKEQFRTLMSIAQRNRLFSLICPHHPELRHLTTIMARPTGPYALSAERTH